MIVAAIQSLRTQEPSMRWRNSLAVVLVASILPSLALAQSTAPNWVKISDKNGFSARDSCGELVFNNRIWLMGGWVDSFKDPPRDVWSSPDGKEWTKNTETAAWKHS